MTNPENSYVPAAMMGHLTLGEGVGYAAPLNLDSDEPLPQPEACPLRNPGDDQPCESCQ